MTLLVVPQAESGEGARAMDASGTTKGADEDGWQVKGRTVGSSLGRGGVAGDIVTRYGE